MTDWSLQQLIAPISTEEFFNSYFESERLLVRRNHPDYFSDLLDYEDVDRFLTTQDLKLREVNVVDSSRKITSPEYAYADDTIKAAEVFRLHDNGATIILNHLHRKHPPLAALCAALELEFSSGFQTNIYVTPPGSQGFNAHFDTHDVIVLQIAGSKRWQLYDTPVKLALKGHGEMAKQEEPGPTSEEFDLRAGDTLYIPRGLVHDAASTDETSMHITVGVMSWTWFDFMQEAMESLAMSDHEIRAALPPAFAGPGYDPQSFKETFVQLAERMTKDVNPDDVRRRFADRLIDRRRPFLRNQMSTLKQLNKIDVETRVGCRPFLSVIVDRGEEEVSVRIHRNKITLPAFALDALEFALENKNFRVADLPGDLDDDGKLVLVRRLIKEGLLQLIEPSASGPNNAGDQRSTAIA